MVKNRRDRRPHRWHFTFLFVLFMATGILEAANPWVHTFNPIRTLYVSPNGDGDGSQGDPMSLSTAMNTAQPGDLYWLTAGTYTGAKVFTKAGTSSNPIVWRGQSGAIINGSMELNAAHNWAWGLEIKDPNGNGQNDGITMYGTGSHAINNIIHDLKGRVGLGAWNTGSGHVIYGNIIYKQIANGINPHNIYTQNDYVTHGWKYFVQNMVLDSWDVTSSTYNFHAYTQGNMISGFHLEKNIFRKGKCLIGGTGLPADNEIVKENYFYDAPAVFGWNVPTQVKFTNNYLGRTYLDTKFFWGEGEVVYIIPDQSVYTGNSIMKPNGEHVRFRTAAFMPNWCVGCPEIRSGDSFNNNTYSSPFTATFWADNNDDGTVDFNTWKTDTQNAGNAFDTNSNVVSTVPNKVVVMANEYESQRGHLAIYNWSLNSTVTVDLSSILPNGTDFQILDPRNMGTPVYQGTYTAPVNVPTGGLEFMALLVVGSGTAPPPPDSVPPDTTITSSFCGSTVNTSTVTVEWTGSDNTTPTPNLVYAYKLDSGSYSSYSSATSHTFNDLSNGSHTVSVKAKDEAGNVDPSPAQCTFTVNVTDTTAPVLSNVAASNVTSNSATVTWDTNEASDSQVEYATSPCPCGNNTPLDSTLVTSHSRTITGLNPNTTYHFRAKSRDAAGNLGYSSDQTFTTDNAPPPPPQGATYFLEPEAGALTGPMIDKKNKEASNHKFVESSEQDQGTVTFNLDIQTAGTYIFWARVKAPDSFQDSFYVSADGGAEDIFDCNQSSDFQWSRVKGRNSGDPRTFSFSAGPHTLKFRGREPGTSLDMLAVSDNTGYVPPAGSAVTELYKVLAKKIKSTTAKIKWRSTVPMDSLVEYGTTVGYGNTSTLDPAMVVKHKLLLENLQPNTTYHFRVTSVDESGNKWVSADFSFTTLP